MIRPYYKMQNFTIQDFFNRVQFTKCLWDSQRKNSTLCVSEYILSVYEMLFSFCLEFLNFVMYSEAPLHIEACCFLVPGITKLNFAHLLRICKAFASIIWILFVNSNHWVYISKLLLNPNFYAFFRLISPLWALPIPLQCLSQQILRSLCDPDSGN